MARIYHHPINTPLPREERRRKKGGPSSPNDKRTKRNRILGNASNRHFYCNPHAHDLDPKRFNRLSDMVKTKLYKGG